MNNILTTVENLLPGDTWDEGINTFVIYKVTPIGDYQTKINYINLRPGFVPMPGEFTIASTARFVTDRPK